MSSEVTAATSALAISDDQPKSSETPSTAKETSASATDASPGSSAPDKAEATGETDAPGAGAAAPTAATAAASAAAPDAEATAANPGTETKAPPVHEDAPPEGPLAELNKALAGIISDVQHQEMWGIDLTNVRDPPTCIVLQKFLRANNNDPVQAGQQLKKALTWRKEFRPLSTLQEKHDRDKFDGLGYATHHKPSNDVDDTPDTVITWNIYGGVQDKKATFSDLDAFCRWRVALMELGIQGLKIDEATAPIPEDGEDMYRMIQVHDYLDVSFLRLDPEIKAASRKVIEIFSTAYPELLEHKYFVNVPYVMNWIFNFFKMFMAKETIAKFHPMAKGTMLGNELPAIADSLPGAYGGRGPELKDDKSAILTRLTDPVEEETKKATKETKSDNQEAAGTDSGAKEAGATQNAAPSTEDKKNETTAS